MVAAGCSLVAVTTAQMLQTIRGDREVGKMAKAAKLVLSTLFAFALAGMLMCALPAYAHAEGAAEKTASSDVTLTATPDKEDSLSPTGDDATTYALIAGAVVVVSGAAIGGVYIHSRKTESQR